MTKLAVELKALGLTIKQFAELAETPSGTAEHWYYGRRRTPGIAFAFLKLINKHMGD